MGVIGDYMASPVLSVECLASVQVAAKHMKDQNATALLITEYGDYVGIATETDIVFKIVAEGRDTMTTLASSIMSQPIITVDRNCPAIDARKIMIKHKVHNLAVTEDGEIVGMVSTLDLIGE